jgi:hypothetical protein
VDRQEIEQIKKLTPKERERKWRDQRKIKGLCARCDKVSMSGHTVCTDCQTNVNIHMKGIYTNRKQTGRCVQGCGRVAENGLTRCEICNKIQTDKHRDLRHEVVVAYGGKCVCCSERIEMLLTIDHKLNNGARERRRMSYNAFRFYRKIVREGFPDIYQLLCWNCNYGKFRNGGLCPHQTLTT